MQTGAAAEAPSTSDRRDRVFFAGMALVIAVTVFVGFAPTFYLRSRNPLRPDALPFYLQLHGTLFTAWILLFIVQVGLAGTGQVRRHRQLGWAGAVLALLMVASGATSGVLSMRRESAAGYEMEASAFLMTPLSAMAVFAALVAAAVAWRRQPATHKRLMLLATISLLDAALARWPLGLTADWAFLAATDVYILAAIAYDVAAYRTVAPACIWGGAVIIVGQGLRLFAGPTDAWRAIARQILQ